MQIKQDIEIRDALKSEAEFFNRHPVYSQRTELNFGFPLLTRSLNKILVQHIQRCIPDLTKNISKTI